MEGEGELNTLRLSLQHSKEKGRIDYDVIREGERTTNDERSIRVIRHEMGKRRKTRRFKLRGKGGSSSSSNKNKLIE